MKTYRIGWWLIVVCALAGSGSAQQFTQTVTRQNTNCNSTCSVIDVPELNGNPSALLFITPIGNTKNLNPHPIAAYYMYLKKWSVFNMDSTTITEGSKFNVEWYANPDTDRFVFVVPGRTHFNDPAYIDNVALNNNPNAKIRIFATNPPGRGAIFNRNEVKVEYDPAVFKWFVVNANGTPVAAENAYNIFISAPTAITDIDPNIGIGSNRPGRPPAGIPINTPGTPLPVGPQPAPTVTPAPQPLPSDTPIRRPQPNKKRWVLRQEAEPTIEPNSEVLLFIHGMDSRAEEADDITKALFMARDMPSAMPTPTPAPTPNPMVTLLNQLLQKYKSCILEKYETQQNMVSRGLPANASGLTNTNGLQARDTVICVGGNPCSLAQRASSFVSLQAQANLGNPTNFEMSLERAIPKDCFMCSKHQEMHTKHVHCTMEAGGNSGFQGPYFEGCKAGVDVEALANSVIHDISGFINDVTDNRTPVGDVIGGASIATNHMTFRFASCANPAMGCPETCDHPDVIVNGKPTAITPFDMVNGQQTRVYFAPVTPAGMLDTDPAPGTMIDVPAAHNIGRNEGRLSQPLRDAAKTRDPRAILGLATGEFLAGHSAMGSAYADLSVTGREAFRKFKLDPPQEDFCQSLVPQPPPANANEMVKACATALDRAYRVANFLRTGQRGDTPALKTAKTTERNALGWIAVSGEDDQPHRPVNVPSSDFPQYDLKVDVEAPMGQAPKLISVHTRYTIAQAKPAGGGKNLVIISLDLPTSGYADNIDFNDVSPLSDIGNPKWTPLPIPIIVPVGIEYLVPGLPPVLPPGTTIPPGTPLPDFQATGKTPVLDFIETFVVRFAETLDQKVPFKNDIKAVMGGSLGGNMTFRLGRRQGVPWLPKFVVWSPASIWSSMGEGGDLFKHFAVRTAWENANNTRNGPSDADRAGFFGGWDKAIVPVIIPMAQSGTWTSNFYPCKNSSVAGARLERQETFDKNFLAWHWRLGGEQLLFSQLNRDPATNQPLYMLNQKPMLLGCGIEDHVAFNDICPATQTTAALMTMTPGKALFLDKTGHSLDNERRNFWATQIIGFLGL
ncbi:MAG: hypothetical protein ABI999_06115 [Acidobacteriota bacterium]